MNSSLIGRAYLCGKSSQLYVPTTPGRGLRFIGGAVDLRDSRDVPFALNMAGIQVEIEPEYADLLPVWTKACGPFGPKAKIHIVGAQPEPEAVTHVEDRKAAR